MQYKVGEENFASREAAARRAREILHGTPIGAYLSGAAFLFVRALLDRHPNATGKIGVGVESIGVHTALYGHPGFFLVRTDGTWTDFSYRTCFDGKNKLMGDLRRAMRAAIVPDVVAAKNAAFSSGGSICCPFTGDVLSPTTCHMDHAPPATFEAIFRAFCSDRKIEPESVEILGYGDGEMEKRLADKTLEDDWCTFHRARMHLRVVSVQANLSIIPAQVRATAKRAANENANQQAPVVSVSNSNVSAPPRSTGGSTPFVKWAGGKRWLAPTAAPMINSYLQKNPQARYIEPFVGGGALALALDRPRALLSDLCVPLVNAYRWVKATPESVIRELETIVARGVDEASYYRVRKAYATEKGALVRAAQFLYLNHTCFNGLMRTNRSGHFNVPYGFRTQPWFPTIENLQRVKNTLVQAIVYAADFREALGRARPGDLVYADSPYDGTYEGYTGSGFSEKDQADLAQALHDLVDRGVVVVATNADTPRVRDWYAWAEVRRLTEHHSIAANERRRGLVDCVWIASSPAFLLSVPVEVDPNEIEQEIATDDTNNERGIP